MLGCLSCLRVSSSSWKLKWNWELNSLATYTSLFLVSSNKLYHIDILLMCCYFFNSFSHYEILHRNSGFILCFVVGNVVASDHLLEYCFLIIMNCKNSLKLTLIHYHHHTFSSFLSPFKSITYSYLLSPFLLSFILLQIIMTPNRLKEP
jgi:hypothetical protein